MPGFDHTKYRPFAPINIARRTWPDQVIRSAPVWCSVDLRDGNQALIEPMSVDQKKMLFALLVKVGFKEIEVGFPSASQPDYDFVRWLIEQSQVPEDVTLQVLTQARPELIERTFASLKGARRAVVHVYNSTSRVQRERVFKMDRQGIIDIAVNGARTVKSFAEANPGTEWVFQYSPESFTGTELDFAVEIVDSVVDVWQPTPENPAIINLPATVEVATPNVFADQIEWFCSHVKQRDSIIVSVHTHNDRGCGVAAAELAVMAGAQRVEGTLLGNGERTGNMDIVTMAMNLYSQGVDPLLNLSDMDEIVRVVKSCTQLPVHPRHPYAGELVYTAFSGSHQDAIKKCLALQQPGQPWEVAYLPIDPEDLGRTYQEVIRVNSQSGKGGVAYALERDYGVQLPRWLQIDFSRVVQQYAEVDGGEVSSEIMWELFNKVYLDQRSPVQLSTFEVRRAIHDEVYARLNEKGHIVDIAGEGQGVMDVFVQALARHYGVQIDIQEYNEHALSPGSDSDAVACVQMSIDGHRFYGCSIHGDIVTASLTSVLSAVNQYFSQQRAVA
ncbi:MAG: 2-isopropylmalate synthase [Proteobacteria bacterium]|nr:MAG: 2-isopropylmalate synthase [Pseudomonadota bacterium]